MTLNLTLVSSNGQAVSPGESRQFEGASVTIGRGSDNDWTLPDAELHLSKRHCIIRFQDGGYLVTDVSTNGVFINGSTRPLGNGASAPLNNGDRLGLGEYEILVQLSGMAGAAAGAYPPARAEPSLDPFAAGASPFGSGSTPFDRPGASLPDSFSANDLLNFASQPAPGAAGHAFGSSSFFDNPPARSSSPFEPSSPFASPAAGDIGIGRSGSGLPGDLDWDSILGKGPSGPDLPEDKHTYSDHLASENAYFRPPKVVQSANTFARQPVAPPLAQDWAPAPRPVPAPDASALPLDWNPAAPAAQMAVPPAARPEPLPAPPPRPAAKPPEAMPAAATAPAVTGDVQALVRAFWEGAGLDAVPAADEDPVEFMRRAGRAMREMTAGLADAMSTRALVKSEYRIDQTVIQATNNNPLKFSIDQGATIVALLGRQRPGYLPGLQAIQEAFRDLKTHEMAVLGSMQAAAAALLAEFQPTRLKKRFDQQSTVKSIIPSSRKAKYWDIYEAQYEQIAGAVFEDVRGTFGSTFAQAYEEQQKKL